MKKQKKNRGVALVTVILTVAIIAVLGIAILYAAYTGLNMRLTAKNSANTFYDAESVLNEIVAGLEEDMSEQYIIAYTKIMTLYGSLGTVHEMQDGFQSEFILNMVEVLHEPANGTLPADDSKYSLAKLRSYITGTYANTSYSISYDTTRTGSNALQTLTDGIVLRNIKVDVTRGSFKNSITTDIKISVPSIVFSRIAAMPEITDYVYIADSGVEVGGGLTVTLDGAAYSGNSKNQVNGSDASLVIGSGATLNVENSPLLVVNGELLANGTAKFLTGATKTATTNVTSVWAENIHAKNTVDASASASNTLSLLGRTYVADDITLDGSENNLILGGQYFGYSYGTESAGGSSAIILNGAKTTLDMSALDSLIVAGTAYVKASGVSSGIENQGNEDIITGDSVAIKSNQFAYLVPSECEGISSNPMSYTQFEKLKTDNPNWKQTALNSILPSLNKSIASFGIVDIVPVYSASEGGTVYLYLKFADVSEAAIYFMEVYKSNGTVGQKVRSYMDNYLAGVVFNADSYGNDRMTRVVTNGNYLAPGTYDSATGKWTAVYKKSSDSAGAISQELGSYAKTFEALCTKLVTTSTSITSEESTRTVFNNLIDVDQIYNASDVDSLMQFYNKDSYYFNETYRGYTFTGVEFDEISGVGKKATFTSDEAPGIQAIVVDNAGGNKFSVLSNDSTIKRKGIIIATGDVEISTYFDGLIICGGKLTVIGNAKLSMDESAVTTAMKSFGLIAEKGSDIKTFAVLNLFRGGEEYTLSSSAESIGGKDMSDVRNCIGFENWASN